MGSSRGGGTGQKPYCAGCVCKVHNRDKKTLIEQVAAWDHDRHKNHTKAEVVSRFDLA